MTWSLIEEAGLEYAALSDASRRQPLCFPTYVARAEDGSYLIAEEQGTEKQVPFRFQCRTLRVAADGSTRFDSVAEGIDDGFGCLMNDGQMAIVRRTRWELLIVSPDGSVVDCLPLERFSKRIPRYVSWTTRGTFLLAFYNRSFDVDLVEIDRRGQLLWYLPAGATSVGIPATAQLLPGGTVLIADSFRHFAVEVDRQGKVLWQFGEAENPASHASRLSSPNSARSLPDGRRLIADTRNHRILLVSPSGSAQPIPLPASRLCDPTYADQLPNGHYLVCDTGNARVLELSVRGEIVWEYGATIARRRELSYPRSVSLTGPRRYLVADTGNNRIVELSAGDVSQRRFQTGDALFWPRCVRPLPSGSLLVADARNGRILELSADGRLLRQLAQIHLDGPQRLQDPHDVRLLPNGHLLICDSPQNLVIQVDWSGTVHQAIGQRGRVPLKDPHSAQQLSDGSTLIADTGHHRVVIVDRLGECVRQIDAVYGEGVLYKLHQPRYVEADAHGTLAIADTGHNRILGATLAGQLLWEFDQVPGSRLPRLSQPRWVTLVEANEILVCDHFHHRILHVRWHPPEGPES